LFVNHCITAPDGALPIALDKLPVVAGHTLLTLLLNKLGATKPAAFAKRNTAPYTLVVPTSTPTKLIVNRTSLNGFVAANQLPDELNLE
jgi:hypothetical protein